MADTGWEFQTFIFSLKIRAQYHGLGENTPSQINQDTSQALVATLRKQIEQLLGESSWEYEDAGIRGEYLRLSYWIKDENYADAISRVRGWVTDEILHELVSFLYTDDDTPKWFGHPVDGLDALFPNQG